MDVPRGGAEHAIAKYAGSWRRFEKLEIGNWKLEISKAELYSDYAHHPTEIKATLAAFREKFLKKKIICVFQPHQADRLTRLFKDFAGAFDLADTVVFIPTYRVSGREAVGGEPKRTRKTRDAFDLAQEVRKKKDSAFYAEGVPQAVRLIEKDFTAKRIVIFMGAGDIDAEVRKFLKL